MSSSLKSPSWALALLVAACASQPKPKAVQHAPVVAPTASQTEAPPPPETTVFESSTALMPRAVTSFGAAALGGTVYAFGGYSGTPHAYSRDGQSGDLSKLDPKSGAFEKVATSEPVQGAALVAAGDALVRVGGMRAQNRAGEPEVITSLDEVATYTPGAAGWTALPALPKPRSSHAAAVIGRTLYVVGGWTLAGSASTGTFADSALALDLDTKETRVLPQPFQARALAAAPLDGKLVALGGMNASGKLTREVHVLDPKSGSWSRAADLPMDAFGIAASSTGDVLYASARDGDVYALEKVDGAWRAVGALALPRFFHQLVAVDAQHLVALGGISGMHGGPRIRVVETLDPTSEAPRVLSFALSNPLPARNRQGVFLYGDSLYVFGGNKSLGQHDFAPDDFTSAAARLDLASLTWAPMAAYPVARQTVQTLVEDGEQPRALALGGFGHDGSEARAHADAYVYDLENDRWAQDAGALPTPRTQFGLVASGGERWVFGGLDFKPEAKGEAQFDHPISVLRAAPGRPFEPAGVELPAPRRAFAGALLDGRYYLVGGMAGGFSPVPTCDVLELASKRWSHVACPKATRISGQLVALGGKLYLAGGSSVGEGQGLTPNRTLEVFDPKTNKWSTLVESLPIEPRHLTMLAYEKSLVLYSAHDQDGRVHVTLVTPKP